MKHRKPRTKKIKHAPATALRSASPTALSGNGSGNAPLLTLTEAAYRLGRVHRTTIMRWVKEGRLRCVRLSRKAILFEMTEIDRFIQEHRYSGH
jgi:excisionase family DNA binding protein